MEKEEGRGRRRNVSVSLVSTLSLSLFCLKSTFIFLSTCAGGREEGSRHQELRPPGGGSRRRYLSTGGPSATSTRLPTHTSARHMIEEVERMEMGCVRGVVEGVQSTCTDAKVRDRVGEEMQYLVGRVDGRGREWV